MFKSQNFCHVASNNRNNVKAGVFIYRTTDNLATVTASGYFNERIIDINLHDLIIHEKIDASDNTKVERNVLCVTERTLSNVGTIVVKSKWEGDIEQAIEDLETYVNNNFLKLDGTSTMTGVLKMRASVSFECAIAPYWHGVGFYKLNDDDSVTLMASMEATDGFEPGTNNTYNIGSTSKKWKNLYLAGKAYMSVINNGFDIAIPVTNSADTFALKSQVDLAANSGSQLYTTGVWYAKMYSASVVPTGAEYDGRNYADFSQVDNDNNPIVVIYEGQSGAWVEIDRITPPAAYNGYVTITSKIWDIAEQTDQQGGEILWSYNQKTFTPYPKIVSVAGFVNTDLNNLTATGKANVSAQGTYDPNETYNAGTVGEAITGKANTDLSNVNSTGKTEAVSWGRQFNDVSTVLAQGGGGIATSYDLSQYLGGDTTSVKMGLFSVKLVTTQSGFSRADLKSDTMTGTAARVCGTNNGFSCANSVWLPFKKTITLSFPETAGGIHSNTALVFVGWM